MKKLLTSLFMLNLIPFFAADGAGGAGVNPTGENGAGASGEGNNPPGGTAGGEGTKPPEKTHTQADVDKAVQDRLAREQKKHQKVLDDMKTAMGGKPPAGAAGAEGGQGAGDAQMAQTKLQAETMMAQANQRLVEATATTEAVKLGIDPKYVADAVRLCDLTKVEVGEDGKIDAGAISKALDEVIKRVPVFKITTENAGGFRVGGQGSTQPSSNGWGQTQGTPGATPQGKSWNRQNR